MNSATVARVATDVVVVDPFFPAFEKGMHAVASPIMHGTWFASIWLAVAGMASACRTESLDDGDMVLPSETVSIVSCRETA